MPAACARSTAVASLALMPPWCVAIVTLSVVVHERDPDHEGARQDRKLLAWRRPLETTGEVAQRAGRARGVDALASLGDCPHAIVAVEHEPQ